MLEALAAIATIVTAFGAAAKVLYDRYRRSKAQSVAATTTVADESATLRERCLELEIRISETGEAQLTYNHEIENAGSTPVAAVSRELWFENATQGIPLSVKSPDAGRETRLKVKHETSQLAKFSCLFAPALAPGEDVRFTLTAKPGRVFLSDHFWRQSVERPTDRLRMRIRQASERPVVDVDVIVERPDGSDLRRDDLASTTFEDGISIIDVEVPDLEPRQAVTVRWRFAQ